MNLKTVMPIFLFVGIVSCTLKNSDQPQGTTPALQTFADWQKTCAASPDADLPSLFCKALTQSNLAQNMDDRSSAESSDGYIVFAPSNTAIRNAISAQGLSEEAWLKSMASSDFVKRHIAKHPKVLRVAEGQAFTVFVLQCLDGSTVNFEAVRGANNRVNGHEVQYTSKIVPFFNGWAGLINTVL